MTRHKNYQCGPQCAAESAFEPIIGKWKASILFLVSQNPRRFNELSRLLNGITRRILAKQLKEMEDDLLLTRSVLCEKPIAVEYSLGQHGETLVPILKNMITWRRACLVKEAPAVQHLESHSMPSNQPYLQTSQTTFFSAPKL